MVEISVEDIAALRSRSQVAIALSLVRKHNAEEIDIYRITSKDELKRVIGIIGSTQDDAIELHFDTVETKINSARKCADLDDWESALLIISTLIETEINYVIRIALRIRNYSHGMIDDALKGISLKTKINIFLPLLGVELSERERLIALEQIPERNKIVHYKAKPQLEYDEGTVLGDYQKVKASAKDYFSRHSLLTIENCYKDILDRSVFSQRHVVEAMELIDNFFL